MDTTPKEASTRYLEQMLEATKLGNKIQNVKWAERNYQEYSSLSKHLYEDPEIRQRLDIEVARFADVAHN